MDKFLQLLFLLLVPVALPVFIYMFKTAKASRFEALLAAAAAGIVSIPATLLVAPFAPFFVSFAVFTAVYGQAFRQAIFWCGVFAALVFALAVTIPYHYQGYKELGIMCATEWSERCGPGRGLGITQFGPVSIYSYILTFPFGRVYLFLAVVAICAGKVSRNLSVDIMTKILPLGFICFCYLEFDQFKIINDVME
jgi:hypothetical protein